MKIIIAILAIAAMLAACQTPASIPPAQSTPAQPVVEYYNGYPVVYWLDQYSVCLLVDGQPTTVTILPEPSNLDPVVDWDAFDAWQGVG